MNLKPVKTLTRKEWKRLHFTWATKFCILPSLLFMPIYNIIIWGSD